MKKLLYALFIVCLLTGCGKKKEVDYTKDYEGLETKFLELTKKFINLKGNENQIPKEEGDISSISLRILYNGNVAKEKFIDPATNKECDDESFVHIKMENGDLVYTVRLTCGNYTTP
ncbi:MAG: hypothetical protein PHS45_01855 [Bacilli bacterium]|nr:hypothetical protein [Bacilli bacterium]